MGAAKNDETRGEGGGQAKKSDSAPARRSKPGELGSLEGATRVLWTALTRSGAALRARDHSTALKAAHAVAQCATAYARLVEVSELEARIKALEGLSTGEGEKP